MAAAAAAVTSVARLAPAGIVTSPSDATETTVGRLETVN